MEQELRKQAIQRYRNNEKPKSIYTDLNRSNIGSLNGSSATRAALLIGTRINQELRTRDQQRSVRLTNNGSSLSETP